MNLSLTDEQRMLQDSALALLGKLYDHQQRERSVQDPQRCRGEVWRQFGEMGWLALPLPERCEGLGGSELDVGLLMHCLGQHLVVEPFHACAILAARIFCEVGGEGHPPLLADIASGRQRLAFAHLERGVRDPFEAGTAADGVTAREASGKWLLHGRKFLAQGAPGAGHLLVSGRDDAGVPCLWLVAAAAEGLEVRPCQTATDGAAGDLVLQDTPGLLLAHGQAAVNAVRGAVARAHVALGWDACGAMQAALRGSVEYTSQRVQFGQPIARFQVIQHRLAEMAVATQEARAACELASVRLDAAPGDLSTAQAMAALVGSKVGRCARFVAQEAVQVHGAMGVCEELSIAATFRRLTAFGALTGAAMRHSLAYGRAALAGNSWQASVVLGPAPALERELQA